MKEGQNLDRRGRGGLAEDAEQCPGVTWRKVQNLNRGGRGAMPRCYVEEGSKS